MNTVKVKICGIQTLEAAQAAIDAGADFLGFVFEKGTRHYIDPIDALGIKQSLKGAIQIVGVFMNQSIDEVNHIAQVVGLDFIQLHGDETPSDVAKAQKPVIKVFRLESDFDEKKVAKKMWEYAVPYFLVDRATQGKGVPLDPSRVAVLTKQFPIFLAGGLTVVTVRDAIQLGKPFGVDVSSGVETNAIKDSVKIKAFIQNAKGLSL